MGCQAHLQWGQAPPRALQPQPESALGTDFDEILGALTHGDTDRVVGTMTPSLRQRLGPADLHASMERLGAAFGVATGIMEEHRAQEGPLTWYSALVVHSIERERREILTPVLYQLALTPNQELDRLLVREHVFIELVRAPAEHFEAITRLHVPARGEWTMSQGGPTRTLNAHHGSVSQRFAYDLVLVLDGRFRDPKLPRKSNESYYGYGQPLLAPGAGEVIRIVEGVADNEPEVMGRAGGNGVVIDHGFGEISSLWHARPGSVRVKVGDHVEAGQVIAEVGNSGRSSGAHIHVHLTRGDGDFALPAPFVDLRVDGVAEVRALPRKGDRIEARRLKAHK